MKNQPHIDLLHLRKMLNRETNEIQSSQAMNDEIIKELYFNQIKLENLTYRLTLKWSKIFLNFVLWFIFWHIIVFFTKNFIPAVESKQHLEDLIGPWIVITFILPFIAGYFILGKSNEAVFLKAVKKKFKIHPFLGKKEAIKRYLAASHALSNSSYISNKSKNYFYYTSDVQKIYEKFLDSGIGGVAYNLEKMASDIFNQAHKEITINQKIDKNLKDDIEDIFKNVYFNPKGK